MATPEPASKAIAAVATRARADRADGRRRWIAVTRDENPAPWLDHALATAGRITVNFHPDRVATDGRSVAAGLAATGGYVTSPPPRPSTHRARLWR